MIKKIQITICKSVSGLRRSLGLVSSAAMLLSILNYQLSAFGQGSLTPPGAPAPTMKSLAQIEPRTPISSLPFTITNSGSYYLTANFNVTSGNAITIATNSVTLDLMGFTISSSASPAGGTGVAIASYTDIAILNGHIRGAVIWTGNSFTGAGFQSGISGASPRNIRVSTLSVSGCSADGINLGTSLPDSSSVVDHCAVRTVGNSGINAGSVSDCVATECGGTAIACYAAANSSGVCLASLNGLAAKTAVNCIGISFTGTGLNAGSATSCRGQSTAITSTAAGLIASTADNCFGSCDNGYGYGLNATIAKACYGFSSQGIGLNANSASDCYGYSATGSAGLYAETAQNCHGQSSNGYGLYAETALNCHGYSSVAVGLSSLTALNCHGQSSSGIGLVSVTTAQNCYGESSSDVGFSGLSANNAQNCYGISSGTGNGLESYSAQNCYGYSSAYIGLYAATTAENCSGGTSGNSGFGVLAKTAQNCYGWNFAGGTGLYGEELAIGCYGFAESGTGLSARIANSCHGTTTSGTPQAIIFKYNMP